MKKSHVAVLAFAAGVAILPAIVLAADMPVKAVQAVSSSGFYVWADGSYQSVKLPTYGLGQRFLDPATFFDRGVTTTFDPRVTGGVGAGAVGYILPYGAVPSIFGNNVRIEVGGSYVGATASQSAISAPGSTFNTQLVSGLVTAVIGCNPCFNAATLSSDYSAWQANLKVASDFNYGAVTLTPSLSVFGGSSRNNQGLIQTFGFIGFPQFAGSFYTANSSVKWDDIGAKFGLKATVDVTPWATLGIGGTVGFAGRDTSMSANDACVTFCTFADFSSAVSASSRTTPFLGSVEVDAAYRPWTMAELRIFAGLNFDSRVPGLSSPSFAGAAPLANTPFLGTPAGIAYTSETSYFIGGGFTVKFAPGAVPLATLR